MGSYNKATIVGRLGGDPELRFIPNGKAVCNFNIATEERWKDAQGAQQKITDWHRIVVWGPMAENCGKYLAKGRECLVEGAIRTRSYDDKEGVKRYVTEIIARNVVFLGSNPDGPSGGGRAAGGHATGGGDPGGGYPPSPGDDDIPF